MTVAVSTVRRPVAAADVQAVSFTVTAANDTTDWAYFTGDVMLQVSGAASAISATMRRSVLDPTAQGAQPDIVTDPTAPEITGAASAADITVLYSGVGGAWWSVKVNSITGGNAVLSLTGGA